MAADQGQAEASQQKARAQKIYYGCPAVVGISGPPGLGKTVDCLYSFPRALFIAAPGSLKPAVTTVGWVPQAEFADNVEGIAKVVQAALQRKNRDFDAVVVDDFGAAVSSTELEMMGTIKDGRAMYKRLAQVVRKLMEDFRDFGVHVVVSTHKKDPKTATNEAPGHPGGPALPGALMTVVPSITDLWVNMYPDAMRRPHPASYAAGLSPMGGQGTRDRHGICGDKAPPNLGELLRKAGYKISRPPGMEWHEEAIEQLAQSVLQGQATIQQAATYAVETLRSGNQEPWQIRWFLRDLADRIEINRAVQQRNAALYAHLGVSL